jgi:uncharacterized Tic20 family protein
MQPDEDDRILGALAHAGILANVVNLAGMIAATLIWATQRERSRFVRAHALQALAYQGAVLLVALLLGGLWVACLALSLIPAAIRPDLYTEGGPPAGFWFALLALILPVGFVAAATVYGLVGAYQVYRGRAFFYPLVGRLVRRDLEATTDDRRPTTDDRRPTTDDRRLTTADPLTSQPPLIMPAAAPSEVVEPAASAESIVEPAPAAPASAPPDPAPSPVSADPPRKTGRSRKPQGSAGDTATSDAPPSAGDHTP